MLNLQLQPVAAKGLEPVRHSPRASAAVTAKSPAVACASSQTMPQPSAAALQAHFGVNVAQVAEKVTVEHLTTPLHAAAHLLQETAPHLNLPEFNSHDLLKALKETPFTQKLADLANEHQLSAEHTSVALTKPMAEAETLSPEQKTFRQKAMTLLVETLESHPKAEAHPVIAQVLPTVKQVQSLDPVKQAA